MHAQAADRGDIVTVQRLINWAGVDVNGSDHVSARRRCKKPRLYLCIVLAIGRGHEARRAVRYLAVMFLDIYLFDGDSHASIIPPRDAYFSLCAMQLRVPTFLNTDELHCCSANNCCFVKRGTIMEHVTHESEHSLIQLKRSCSGDFAFKKKDDHTAIFETWLFTPKSDCNHVYHSKVALRCIMQHFAGTWRLCDCSWKTRRTQT